VSYIRRWLQLDSSPPSLADDGNPVTAGIPAEGDDGEIVEEDDADEVRRLERERETDDKASSLKQREQHLVDIRGASLACQAAMGVLEQHEVCTDSGGGGEWQTQKKQKQRRRSYANRSYIFTLNRR